jgi:hypothetical protein
MTRDQFLITCDQLHMTSDQFYMISLEKYQLFWVGQIRIVEIDEFLFVRVKHKAAKKKQKLKRVYLFLLQWPV